MTTIFSSQILTTPTANQRLSTEQLRGLKRIGVEAAARVEVGAKIDPMSNSVMETSYVADVSRKIIHRSTRASCEWPAPRPSKTTQLSIYKLISRDISQIVELKVVKK